MTDKEEPTTEKKELIMKQVGLDADAYGILTAIKNRLLKKYNYTRAVTYSDAVRELKTKYFEKQDVKGGK